MRVLILVSLSVGCAVQSIDAPGAKPATDTDSGASLSDDGLVDSGSAVDDGGPGDSAPGDSGPGDSAPGGCYREAFDGSVSLADLKSKFTGSNWLSSSLEALQRRYGDGHALLDAMKGDPQLSEFADKTSWAGLMTSVDTMCHEETHGWDFETALKTPGKHAFWLRKDLALDAPTSLGFFARNVILPMVGDAGTEMYDETYLSGEQGTYDFVFLADELNAYINGLACATALGSEIITTISFRDGAAAHLYYLQLYLKKARTSYASLYAKMKASPEWMKFVRYEWARGHFWTEASKPFPNFGIEDKKIWAKVNLPENLSEIELFTGEKPEAVACKP